MASRKTTPVKPRSEFNCTLYLADLGMAIKMRGKTSFKSHEWRGSSLYLIFTADYPQQAAYHGSQNVIVFHEAQRAHHLTAMRIRNNTLYIVFEGVEELLFEEPVFEWFAFDLARIDEALQLPRPHMIGFNWEYNQYHTTSNLYVDYRYHANKDSVNSLGAKYIKPNKLDIILEELTK